MEGISALWEVLLSHQDQRLRLKLKNGVAMSIWSVVEDLSTLGKVLPSYQGKRLRLEGSSVVHMYICMYGVYNIWAISHRMYLLAMENGPCNELVFCWIYEIWGMFVSFIWLS